MNARLLSERVAIKEKKEQSLMSRRTEKVCMSLRVCIIYTRDGTQNKKEGLLPGKLAGFKPPEINETNRTCYKKDTGKATYQQTWSCFREIFGLIFRGGVEAIYGKVGIETCTRNLRRDG